MFVYTIGDVVGVVFIVILLTIALLSSLHRYVKQSFCKHEKYRENMACDAICVECDKNLGFIGNVIKERKAWK